MRLSSSCEQICVNKRVATIKSETRKPYNLFKAAWAFLSPPRFMFCTLPLYRLQVIGIRTIVSCSMLPSPSPLAQQSRRALRGDIVKDAKSERGVLKADVVHDSQSTQKRAVDIEDVIELTDSDPDDALPKATQLCTCWTHEVTVLSLILPKCLILRKSHSLIILRSTSYRR